MLVLLGQLKGGIKGCPGRCRLLGFQILITAPAGDGGNDQERGGYDIDRVLVPQLLELLAADLLVYLIKKFRHLEISHPGLAPLEPTTLTNLPFDGGRVTLAIWRWQGKASSAKVLTRLTRRLSTLGPAASGACSRLRLHAVNMLRSREGA